LEVYIIFPVMTLGNMGVFLELGSCWCALH